MTFFDDFQRLVELYKQGKIKDVLIIFDKEILMTPKIDDFREKGIIIFDFEKNEKIHNFLDKLLELNPKDPEILARKGFLLELEMKHENAKYFVEKALEVDSKNKIALQTKGIIYFHNEKFEKALDCYEKILSHDTNNSIVLFFKAITLELIGKDKNIISPIFKAFNFDSLNDELLDSVVLHIINICGLNTARLNAYQTLKSEPKNKIALKIKKFSLQDKNKVRVKISEIFTKHLHREPDSGGLDYFENQIIEGKSFEWIENIIENSGEGKNYWN